MSRSPTALLLGLVCTFLLLVAGWSESWWVLRDGTGLGLRNLPSDEGFPTTWAVVAAWSSLLAAIMLAATAGVGLLVEVRGLAIATTVLLLVAFIAGLAVAWGAPRGPALGYAYPTFLVGCLGGIVAAHLTRVPATERAIVRHGREQGDQVDGKRHGRWLVYDADDALIRIDIYENGQRTSSTPVGPDGRPAA